MTADSCSHCDEEFGYEVGWDDPPKGEGHIQVTWNPADKPSFVVGETRKYCSIECLTQDSDSHPFGKSTPDTDRQEADR